MYSNFALQYLPTIHVKIFCTTVPANKLKKQSDHYAHCTFTARGGCVGAQGGWRRAEEVAGAGEEAAGAGAGEEAATREGGGRTRARRRGSGPCREERQRAGRKEPGQPRVAVDPCGGGGSRCWRRVEEAGGARRQDPGSARGGHCGE